MSLQIWLPLTGNLDNFGLSNYIFTNNDTSKVTIDTYGKIGQCYSFKQSAASWIGTSDNGFMNKFINNHSFTIAMWIKTSKADTPLATLSFGLRLWVSGGKPIMWMYNSTNTVTVTNAITINDNSWHHVVFTYDINSNYANIAVDGKLGSPTKYSSSTTYSSSWANGLYIGADINNGELIDWHYDGLMNDFRIYDHCLSAKEVKELAKGLVLHYRLAGPGGANLLPHTSPEYGLGYMTSYQGGTISWSNEKQYNGHNTIKIQSSSNTTSSGGYVDYNNNVNLISGKTYTYSCMIYSTIDDTFDFVSLGHFQTYNSTDGSAHNRAIKKDSNIVKANTWTKVYITFTPTANVKFYSFFIYFANISQTIYITDIKLEEGSIATPWVPNSADSLYSILGYNNNIEYDCSGFKNNGIKSGTITWDIDSPRYTTSYRFQKPSGVFCQPNLAFSQFTITFWGKHTEIGKMLMGSNGSLTDLNSDWYWYGDKSFKYPGGEYYYAHNAGPEKINEWYHYAAVYDGTKIQIYRNSISEGSQVKTGILSLNKLSVGNGYPSENYWENGNVADFRIYATALSAEDIAELYHSAVIVDNTGKSYAYEYFET